MKVLERIMLAGDVHGNGAHLAKLFQRARQLECEKVIALGDFGVWPGSYGRRYLELASRLTEETGIALWFLDGNHEDHDKLDKVFPDARRAQDPDLTPQPWPNLPGITYLPRGATWSEHGVTFMALGGAYSVDEEWRTPGVSWWPQEQLKPWQAAEAIRRAPAQVHVLLTHDCPTMCFEPQLTLNPKLDARSRGNRELVDAVRASVRPPVTVHGHMHTPCAGNDEIGLSWGLACDTDPFRDSYAVMELFGNGSFSAPRRGLPPDHVQDDEVLIM